MKALFLLLAFCSGAQAADIEAAKRAFRGDAQQWTQALPVFSDEARHGNPQASYYLALMLKNGMGTPRDGARAAAAMRVAAEGGVPPAMFLLSNMLLSGDGVTRDEAAARAWLEKAAAQEYPAALQQMSMAIRDGAMGYLRDERRAEETMKMAAHAMRHPQQEP